MTDPAANPYQAAATARWGQPQQPLGAQVNNWVNQSAQNMPALNPGAGGPIHGQQVPFHSDNPNRSFSEPVAHADPAVPGGAPAVALPPGAVPPAPVVAAPQTFVPPQVAPQQVRPEHVHPGQEQHWQDRMAHIQQNNPARYARMQPLVQQMMQRRGYGAPQTSAVMPNPIPV